MTEAQLLGDPGAAQRAPPPAAHQLELDEDYIKEVRVERYSWFGLGVTWTLRACLWV